MKRTVYLLLLSLPLFLACEPTGTDEVIEETELLEFTHLEVLESGGVTFEATYTGSSTISDYKTGFFISRQEIPTEQYSMDIPGTVTGKMVSGESDSGFAYNEQYYVRAYIKFSTSKILFSEAKSFVSLGSKAPEIKEIDRSLILDTVSIRGKYFTNNHGNITVKFGHAYSGIISVNDSLIRSIVPKDIESHKPIVSVEVHGKKAVFQEFSLLSPSIDKISKTSAALGDTLTIFGKNFDFDNSRNKIIIDEQEVEIIKSSRDSIQFVLPERVSTPTLDVKLETQLQEAILKGAITIKKPVLAALPAVSQAYEIIEISGNNFSIFPEDNKVYFDDRIAKVLEATRTKLKVRIPIGPYEDRQLDVRIEFLGYNIAYEGEFSLKDIWLMKSRLESGSSFRGSKYFVHNNLAYIFEQDYEHTRWKVYIMDPTTDTWSHIYVPYPKPDVKSKDFSIIYNRNSGRIFFYFSAEKDNFYEFFLDTKSFSQRSDYPGVERGVPATFSIDNRLYIGLGRFMDYGYQDREPLSQFWSYDINNDTWKEVATFPHFGERSDLSVFVINGDAYLGNGASDTGDLDFWRYSPDTDKWTRLADFPGARTYTSFFEYAGKAYVYYGTVLTGNPDETAFEYDPGTDTWTVIDPVNHLYYTYFIYPQGSLALRFENAVYLGMTRYPHIEFFKADLNRL